MPEEGWEVPSYDYTHADLGTVEAFNPARILLQAATGLSDTSLSTAEQIRQRFVEGGLDNALNEWLMPGQKRRLDCEASAYGVATACSAAPEGHQRWTGTLADRQGG